MGQSSAGMIIGRRNAQRQECNQILQPFFSLGWGFLRQDWAILFFFKSNSIRLQEAQNSSEEKKRLITDRGVVCRQSQRVAVR